MLLINFDALIRDYPQHARVTVSLKNWVDEHRTLDAIEPTRFTRECKLPPSPVFNLFADLLMDGVVQRAYQVADRDGQLVDQDFESIESIPDRLRNNVNEEFLTREGEVFSVYRLSDRRYVRLPKMDTL